MMINQTVNLIFFNKKKFSECLVPKVLQQCSGLITFRQNSNYGKRATIPKKEDEDISLISRIKRKDNNNCNFQCPLLSTSTDVAGAVQIKQTMMKGKAKEGQGGCCLPLDWNILYLLLHTSVILCIVRPNSSNIIKWFPRVFADITTT